MTCVFARLNGENHMIELLVLIAGVVGLWKFHKAINGATIGAEETVNHWSEGVIKDVALSRTAMYEQWVADTTNADGTRKRIVTHEEMMREFGVK
jgi:hypothetical protein